MKIIVTTTIAAPIAEVWQAYTSPDDIKAWNAASADWHTTHAEVDLRVGGKFCSRMEAKDGSFGFDFAGEYTKLIPHQLIEYVFDERKVSVNFTEGSDGVLVKVSFDPETIHPEEQ
ncbi:MAG: hypothetical protein RLZZ351_723, partial [Pseudomonadota bacterium]